MARGVGWLLGFGVVVWLLVAFRGSGHATELPAAAIVANVASEVPAMASAPSTETVRAGDGWMAIAARTGTEVTALMAANRATAATVIHPGDVVQLPGAGAAPVTRPTTATPHKAPVQVAAPVYAAPAYDAPSFGRGFGGGGGGRTEHVSGYTRRDGTYVHSYNRHPRRH